MRTHALRKRERNTVQYGYFIVQSLPMAESARIANCVVRRTCLELESRGGSECKILGFPRDCNSAPIILLKLDPRQGLRLEGSVQVVTEGKWYRVAGEYCTLLP